MPSTITQEQAEAIRDYFAGVETIPADLGTKEAACSIAGINLALSGELTDTTPECMSRVVGRWIIGVQDAMPAAMRNSQEWRNLLPLAAGTGRHAESERAALIMDWMWGAVLTYCRPTADARGYGAAWAMMCQERTVASANAAARAARAARDTYAAAAAIDAANAAADAAAAAAYAAAAATAAAYAATAAAYAADAAAYDASASASAAAFAARDTYAAAAWEHFAPAGVLVRLIAI